MSEGIILQKLDEIGQKVGSIEQKLEQHDQRFEKIDRKMEEFGGEFKEIRADLKDIRQTLADHDEQLEFIREYLGEKVLTRQEFEQFHEEYLGDQDELLSLFKSLDQDRLFTNLRIDRLEEKVGKRRLRVA